MTEHPLGVLLVNRNAQGGGAERVALSLQEGLSRRGHRSWLAVGRRNLDRPDIFQVPRSRAPALLRLVARASSSGVRRARRLIPRARLVRDFLEEFGESPANA